MPDLNEKTAFILPIGEVGNQVDCPAPLRHQANVVAFFGYPLSRQEILVNVVIPARMPVSSAMEGNFPMTLPHDLGSMPNYSFTVSTLKSRVN